MENLGDGVTTQDIKVFIAETETGVLELKPDTVKTIVPQGFMGGEIKLVIGTDTTNARYLSLLMRKMITVSAGGSIEHPCGASVEVTAGGLNADMQISISDVSVESANELGILEDTSEVLVQLEPSGTTFIQPVTVGLPIPSNADSSDILEAVYYSESERDWLSLSITRRDYVKGLLFIDTNHFSVMKARKWHVRTEIVQGLTFVSIPGGTFQMGSVVDDYLDQRPVHQVTVSAFLMSSTEITNSQYAAYLNAALAAGEITATESSVSGAKGDYSGQEYIYLSGNVNNTDNKCWISYGGSSFSVAAGKENWPVVYVTWYGSKAYALMYGFDLPREAEWEYAARGGKGYEYGTDDGTISRTKANCKGNRSSPTNVGSYPANPFGLYDLTGNVWEWCNDWYGSYSSENATDPQGPAGGNGRVRRGGDWKYFAIDEFWRTAYRIGSLPISKSDVCGFRVVRR